VLASLAIPVAFGVAHCVFGNRALATGTIATVAAMPGLMINVSRVGNDSLSFLLYTLLFYLTLRLIDRPSESRWFWFLGVTLGLGMLTKAFFVTALPVILLASAWTARRNRKQRWTILERGMCACLLAVAISGWWYAFIHQATGTFTGQVQVVAARDVTMVDRLSSVLRVDWLKALDGMLTSHIWLGAWSFLQLRSWIYHVFGLALLLAVTGLVVFTVKQRVDRRPRETSGPAVFFLMAYLALFAASLLYQTLVHFAVTGLSIGLGWYFSSVAVAEVIVVTAGLNALSPRTWGRWTLVGSAAGFAVLDVYAAAFVLLPYHRGLIVHLENGRLQNFHLGQFPALWAAVGDGSGVSVPLFLLYVAATFACPAVALARSRFVP
jgi:4-amino-4-deoxy-L-arabinose transferase-like glycosyltransferase